MRSLICSWRREAAKFEYKSFRDTLDVTLLFQGKGEEKASQATVGEHLSEQLKKFTASHAEWIDNLRQIKTLSLGDMLVAAIETLNQNESLCRILRTEIGRRWVKDKIFRQGVGKVSEEAVSSRKQEVDLEAQASIKEKPEKLSHIVQSIESRMVPIKGGVFTLGDASESDNPPHEVELGDFEISATQVTQAQYKGVMGNNPSHFKEPDSPVENVTWQDAMAFCERLSKESGRKFTLPTEAQWEFACRAGSATKFCFGDDEKALGDFAWHAGNSGRKTQPVGRKKPHDWGLYDMHGNVWEWCADWYGLIGKEPAKNPTGPEEGAGRVIRGGSWNYPPEYCRSACRNLGGPGVRDEALGFRVLAAPVAGK